jgi:hypothetical protein
MSSRTARPLIVAVSLLAAGCAGAPVDDGTQAAADRARVQPTWTLALEGSEPLPLERMDVFLVEDEEDGAPEIFEIHGPDVALVGTFPGDLRVGYDEDFQRLVGRSIALQPSGGDPREPRNAWVRLGGAPFPVVGGTFTIEKVTGRWSGSHGDKTCHGTIELEVQGAGGVQTLRGRFAVHGVTWG